AGEWRALGGEAGLIGLTQVCEAAVQGENTARRLAVSSGSAERVACARAVRAVARAIELLEQPRVDAGLHPDQGAGGAGRRRALIVDDSPLSASLLGEVLERAGFDVRSIIDDLEAALAAVVEFEPDVVLADLQMPKCDSRELCARIKQTARARPPMVVVVTAMALEEVGT